MLVPLLISLVLCAQTEAPSDPAAVAEAAEPPAPARQIPQIPLDSPIVVSRFSSADEPLSVAWQRAEQALDARGAEGFASDISAPIGPFWGDLWVAGRAYLWRTGDAGVLRAGVERVLYPSPAAGLSETATPLAAYSLLWPEMLDTYYRQTGNAVYTRAAAGYALRELAAHFESALGAEGLLEASKFDAWPAALLGGFSPEAAVKPNAVLNAFYYHALMGMQSLAAEFAFPAAEYSDRAARLARSFEEAFWDAGAGLYRDAAGLDAHSVLANALALGFGLAPAERREGILALIRREGATCAEEFRPYVIETCFRAGETQLALDLIAFEGESSRSPAILYLLPEYLAGLSPASPGWRGARVAPRVPARLDAFSLSIPVSQGRATMHYARETGARLLLPPGVGAWVEAGNGGPVMVKNELSHGRGEITAAQLELLRSKDWVARAGDGLAVWISVGEQMLRVLESGRLVYQARCASSASGVGSAMDSLQTPLGWHTVINKIGEKAVRGQVFRSRQPTREVWQPGEQPSEDLVLTRVILLDGLEPGLNKGGSVDSFARNIYIHGTNDEARLGTPSSHGCIRLSNDDVIEVFELLPKGTPVLITAE